MRRKYWRQANAGVSWENYENRFLIEVKWESDMAKSGRVKVEPGFAWGLDGGTVEMKEVTLACLLYQVLGTLMLCPQLSPL